MPNWCNNTFEVVGKKEDIRIFEKYLDETNGKDWFDFFLPCPQELKDVGDIPTNYTNEELVAKYGASDWYSWSVQNWGCKWNCDANDWAVTEYSDTEDSLTFWFDSPWGPPTELYNWICENTEFDVFGNYHEEGMCFVGRYDNGDNESYEYDPTDVESLESIPEEIHEEWNLREQIEDRAEWDEEDEEEYVEDDSSETLEDLQKEFDEMQGEEDEKSSGSSKKWPF